MVISTTGSVSNGVEIKEGSVKEDEWCILSVGMDSFSSCISLIFCCGSTDKVAVVVVVESVLVALGVRSKDELKDRSSEFWISCSASRFLLTLTGLTLDVGWKEGVGVAGASLIDGNEVSVTLLIDLWSV